MKKYSNIRAARRFVAVLLAVGLTLCVGVGARCIFTRMQLVPAVMSCSVLWLALWAAATMAFGRVYCSTACPMGALMDGVERLRMAVEHLRRRRRSRYKFREAGIRGRYSVLFVVVLCMLLGFGVIPSLLDPYSAYARIVSGLRAFVALPAGRAAGIGVLSAAVAFATLAAVAAVSWRRGRYLCNTWCPVGSALSIVSRNSMFHADVNTDLCVRCLRCVDVCKASCINPSDMTIDPARCVVCFNCMDVCVNDAVTYRRGRHTLAMPLMQRAGAAPSAAASMDGCAGAPQVSETRRRGGCGRRGRGGLVGFRAPLRCVGPSAACAPERSRASGSSYAPWISEALHGMRRVCVGLPDGGDTVFGAGLRAATRHGADAGLRPCGLQHRLQRLHAGVSDGRARASHSRRKTPLCHRQGAGAPSELPRLRARPLLRPVCAPLPVRRNSHDPLLRRTQGAGGGHGQVRGLRAVRGGVPVVAVQGHSHRRRRINS